MLQRFALLHYSLRKSQAVLSIFVFFLYYLSIFLKTCLDINYIPSSNISLREDSFIIFNSKKEET